jgi:hypothetical protein
MREEQKAWREEQNALTEEEQNAIQEEARKAYLEEGQKGGSGGGGQEGKYEKKKYFDEGGVWIPRIVKLLIFIIFILVLLNQGNYYNDSGSVWCESRIC